MIAGRSAEILRQLENTAANDRELLARFVRERDQSAFAELVRRHAPVVLGVCRRVTGHQQDAEDAFQVVFLILARKAKAIGNPDLLGNWLYGVAVRVAQTVRRSVVRRRTREIAVNTIPEPPSSPVTTHSELNPILDEELAALPSWYREAIVLCDLRGVSREEAAAALGVPEGTLSSRLANGRKKLAIRLSKRGIALSAAAIPTALSAAQAVVPTDLLAKTSVLVADWMAAGTIPKPLALFTDGGFTMRKMLLLGLFTAAVAVAGVVYATQPILNPPTTDPLNKPIVAVKPEVVEQPAPDAKPGDKPVAFTSTPRLYGRLNMNFHGNMTVLWTPQGNQLAVAGMQWGSTEGGGFNLTKERLAIQTVTFDPMKDRFAFPEANSQLVGFTSDGKHFLTELREYQLVSGFHKLELWGVAKVDSLWPVVVRTVELDPTETQGYAFAADGKTFRTLAIERNSNTREIIKLHVLEIDATTGKRLKSLLTVNTGTYALSPDGKRLAAIETTGKENSVIVYDVGRATKISAFVLPEGWDIAAGSSSGPNPSRPGAPPRVLRVGLSSSLTFSPDGHRLLLCRGMNDSTYNSTNSYVTRLAPIAGVIGWKVVLNADTGKALPALAGVDHYIDKDSYVDRGNYIDTLHTPQPFTADGRLLALSGTRYVVETQTHGVFESNEQAIHVRLESPRQFLTVWDTDTGKVLKTWDISAKIAFNPVRPVLAILEPNGDNTRLGLWDFSAEVAEKK
ncbi:MAG TPA: RNA polymerase sigma factor [Gemmata sp.]|jgi:RNA polymerase sigma factor (sigma-70 family)|nr:RNA polymerase sigma factor [Gemmata sp.]